MCFVAHHNSKRFHGRHTILQIRSVPKKHDVKWLHNEQHGPHTPGAERERCLPWRCVWRVRCPWWSGGRRRGRGRGARRQRRASPRGSSGAAAGWTAAQTPCRSQRMDSGTDALLQATERSAIQTWLLSKERSVCDDTRDGQVLCSDGNSRPRSSDTEGLRFAGQGKRQLPSGGTRLWNQKTLWMLKCLAFCFQQQSPQRFDLRAPFLLDTLEKSTFCMKQFACLWEKVLRSWMRVRKERPSEIQPKAFHFIKDVQQPPWEDLPGLCKHRPKPEFEPLCERNCHTRTLGCPVTAWCWSLAMKRWHETRIIFCKLVTWPANKRWKHASFCIKSRDLCFWGPQPHALISCFRKLK